MKIEVTKPTAATLLKPSDTLNVYLVNVDGDMAKAILKANASNRKLAQTSVNAYAREMFGKRWELNGDTIRIDNNGKLVDGQHRLSAIIALSENDPEFSVNLLIVTGVKQHTTRTMDDGRKRSAADEINFALPSDEKYGTKIVSALRVLDIFARQEAGGRLTKSTLLALWDNNPLIVDSVKAVFADAELVKAIPLRVSVVVAMHYAASHLMPSLGDKGPDMAQRMLEVMTSGLPTPAYPAGERLDPMHALRELVGRSKAVPGAEWRELDLIRGMTEAWALYAAGEPAPTAKDLKMIGKRWYHLDAMDTALLYGDMPEGVEAAEKAKPIAVDGDGNDIPPPPPAAPKKGKAKPKASKAVSKAVAKAKEASDKAQATKTKADPVPAAGGASTGPQSDSANNGAPSNKKVETADQPSDDANLPDPTAAFAEGRKAMDERNKAMVAEAVAKATAKDAKRGARLPAGA